MAQNIHATQSWVQEQLKNVNTFIDVKSTYTSYEEIPLFNDEGSSVSPKNAIKYSGIYRVTISSTSDDVTVSQTVFVIQSGFSYPGNSYTNQTIIGGGKTIRTRNIPTSVTTAVGVAFSDITDSLKTQINSINSNKSTVIDDSANNIKYPTTKAVKDYVDAKFNLLMQN